MKVGAVAFSLAGTFFISPGCWGKPQFIGGSQKDVIRAADFWELLGWVGWLRREEAFLHHLIPKHVSARSEVLG